MNKKILTLLIILLAGLNAAAGPAITGPITLTQPDGHSFSATLRGDEFGHVLMTSDGCGIVLDRDGYYSYAFFDSDGRRHSSGVHVGDKASSDVLLSSRQIPWQAVTSIASAKRLSIKPEEESILRRMTGGRTLRPAYGTAAPLDEGEKTVKHGLAILAEFSDVPFTYTKADFEALLTQSGYSVNGATGSAKEYFDAQFDGLIEFEFTVSSIVTLSNERAYYGGNDEDGADLNVEGMIEEACCLADAEIDFSQFDDDGDGTVDNVFVFFAGGDEAAGAGDDCIWSQAWYLESGAGISLTLDGVKIDRFACTSELRISGYTTTGYDYEINGIGTFCHEYSHTLGLPDLYDTDYDTPSGSAIAAGLWRRTSLMDGGNYNNDSNTPPYFNAVERDCLGLWEPETLQAGAYTLEPVNLNGRYLRMETGVDGEYYLFECRSNNGWDAYINQGKSAAGLLVYHIDRSKDRSIYSPTYDINTSPYLRWEYYNEVNAAPEHQCADLVEADNRSDEVASSTEVSNADLAGLFFPAGRTEFTPETEPAFRTWDGYSSDLCITDISMDEDGNAIFTVINSNDIATPFAVDISAVTFQDAAIISWSSDYSTTRKAYLTVSDDESVENEITPYEIGNYAYVAEGLKPGVQYTAKIWYNDFDDEPGDVKTYSFTTRSLSSGNSFAYIYFTTPALDDGSFASGTKAPLRVYNATDAASVEWALGSNDIEVGADGYYVLDTAGTLKATITYEDGTKEIITRKITITTVTEE